MRISLVGLNESDIPFLHDIINREGVIGELFRDSRYLRRKEIAEALLETEAGTTAKLFGIVNRDDEEKLLGCIAINNINPISRCGNITHLAVTDWLTGLSAVREAVNYGFNTLNLNRIECRAYENNRLTPLLVRKMGGKHDGTIRQCVYRNGEYQNIVIWSLLREEWNGDHTKSG